MKKKLISFIIICLITSIFLIKISYATDVLMDLQSTDSMNTVQNSTLLINNTTYTADNSVSTVSQNTSDSTTHESIPAVTTTTDYDNSAELSVSNMINIILIAVGVVLILLGIAIIIKLK